MIKLFEVIMRGIEDVLSGLFFSPLPAQEVSFTGHESPEETMQRLKKAFASAPPEERSRVKRVRWDAVRIDKDPLVVLVGLLVSPYLILELVAMELVWELFPDEQIRISRYVMPGPVSQLLGIQRYVDETRMSSFRLANEDRPPWGLVTGRTGDVIRPPFLTWLVTQYDPDKKLLEVVGQGNERDVFPLYNVDLAQQAINWLARQISLAERSV